VRELEEGTGCDGDDVVVVVVGVVSAADDTDTARLLVYAQTSLPVRLELGKRERGWPLEMLMIRLPDESAVNVLQLKRSVNWVLPVTPVLAAGTVTCPFPVAPELVKRVRR
jgi:hypothetical protein